MAKQASDATLLKRAKSDLAKEATARRSAEQQRDHYRARATTAEQEVKAWKERFDILLQKAGKLEPA